MLKRTSVIRRYVRAVVFPYVKAHDIMLARLAARIGTMEGSAGFRNRIINGDMRIAQRLGETGTASLDGVTPAYTLDRWRCTNLFADGAVSVRRAQANGRSQLLVEVPDIPTVAISNLLTIDQFIEAQNIADFKLGTATAATVTLSFVVEASLAGTYSVALQNAANDRTYIAQFEVEAADTPEQKTLTIALDTTGSWGNTNDDALLAVRWCLGYGTNYVDATADSWVAGDNVALAGQVNMLANVDSTFKLSQVQLELGSSASNFEQRPYSVDLDMCQRYYQKSLPKSSVPGTGAGNAAGAESFKTRTAVTALAAGSLRDHTVRFPVRMRSTPTVTLYSSVENTGAAIYNVTTAADVTDATVADPTDTGFSQVDIADTNAEAIALDDLLAFHYTAEAEYGLA